MEAYFVLPRAAILFCCFPSAYGQTRRVRLVRQGSSLSWLSIHIGLQGRKPGESNKLFDLFLPRTAHESVLSVVEKSEYPAAYRPSGSRALAHLWFLYSYNLCSKQLFYLCFLEQKTPMESFVLQKYRYFLLLLPKVTRLYAHANYLCVPNIRKPI